MHNKQAINNIIFYTEMMIIIYNCSQVGIFVLLLFCFYKSVPDDKDSNTQYSEINTKKQTNKNYLNLTTYEQS